MPSHDAVQTALLRLAAERDGIVTASEAGRLGIGRHRLADLAARNVLERIANGVYCVIGASTFDIDAPRRAAAIVGGVVSHRTAARVYGVGRLRCQLIELSVSLPRRGRRLEGVKIYRSANLRDCDVTTLDGLPITTPERTILDLARPEQGLSRRELAYTVECAAYDGVLPMARLKHYLDTLTTKSPGVPVARQVVAECFDYRVDSPAERDAVELLLERGVPRPRHGFIVNNRDGEYLGKVDFAWPERRVVLEIDGYETHSKRHVFNSDRPRGNLLVEAGWKLLRLTPANIADDENECVRQVWVALGLKGRPT